MDRRFVSTLPRTLGLTLTRPEEEAEHIGCNRQRD